MPMEFREEDKQTYYRLQYEHLDPHPRVQMQIGVLLISLVLL